MVVTMEKKKVICKEIIKVEYVELMSLHVCGKKGKGVKYDAKS